MDNSKSPLKTIPNFRDVGRFVNTSMSSNLLKTGLLYRGARPDEASSQDRRRLVEEYGVKTIIDLRTKTEHIQQAKKRDDNIKASAVVPQSNDDVTEPLKIPGITYHDINFNGSAFSRMLISKLSWTEFGKLVGLMAIGYRVEAIRILAPSMNAGGLVGLAINSLDVCGKEVCAVFKVLADSGSWPIMIHCTQGKDRTGLTVLLVLFLLGASDDAVQADYVLSESELLPEKQERLKEISSIGLSEHFTTCPPELVGRVHQHLVEKYGSVEKYLLKVGVSKEMQDRVKTILSARSNA